MRLGTRDDVLDVGLLRAAEPSAGIRPVDAAERGHDLSLDGQLVTVVIGVVGRAARLRRDDHAAPRRLRGGLETTQKKEQSGGYGDPCRPNGCWHGRLGEFTRATTPASGAAPR